MKILRYKGVTLVELLVGVLMLGIFAVGMVVAYNMISKGVAVTKSKTIANNLLQEKIEKLKDYNYYRLLVTPIAALLNPDDTSNPFPPETIIVSGITYSRNTIVRKLFEDTSTGILSVIAPTDPDDGLKRIEVTLTWTENNQTKSISLYNLFNNPDRTLQDGVIAGNVKDSSSANVVNVNVYVTDNPSLFSLTDTNGNYSFRAPGGTYVLRADKKGYVSKITGALTLAAGTTITSNFTNYAKKPTGTVVGYVRAGGSVVTGAYVFSNDDVSNPAVSAGTGAYTLTNVAAGSWKIAATGGGHYGELTEVTILASATATVNISLTTVATDGFITGRVTTGATTPLSGIVMYSTTTSSTDANGNYVLLAPAGAVYVTANYLNANPNYVSESTATPITIAAGTAVSNIDFNLSNGGAISGLVTTNGTDPLPHIPVIAKDFANNERGSALSDAAGAYAIKNLATSGNPYSVFPALDDKEVGAPASISATVAAGTTSAGYNFQVTTGLASIAGTVKVTATNKEITTGVLIVAATGSISTANPPLINAALRGGSTVYYSTVSDSNGSYTLPVRGNSAGTVYNVYGWYTNQAGVTLKSTGSTTVTSGASTTVNFDF